MGPPGAGTRNGEPLYGFAAKRIVHHLIPETPVRISSLRGLGATVNIFAIEAAMDDLAERANQDPGRLSPIGSAGLRVPEPASSGWRR